MPVSQPLSLRLLGGFEATGSDGRPLELGARKARALLAYLALRPGIPCTRESLAGLLWGGIPDSRARNNLRQVLFAVRQAFGDADASAIRVSGETVTLDAGGVDVDVINFRRLVKDGSPESLERAADLYAGELLPDLVVREAGFDEWLTAERDRVRLRAVEAFSRLLAHQSSAETPERAIDTAQALLRLDPLEEVVHRALIRLYLQQGRRSAALRQFQVCADSLERELGVQPDVQTVRLAERARQGVGDAEAGPALEVGAPVESDDEAPSPVVLVVEDDDDTRRLLEEILRDADYRVVVAADGLEATSQLGRQRVDAVITDVVMPTLDGMKLLEFIHENKIAAPVIVLTGREDEGTEIRGLELGAVDYIRKPIRRKVLLLRLENALRMAGTSRAS